MRTPNLPLLALVAVSGLAACRDGRTSPKEAAPPPARIFATVNGVPITRHDLDQRQRRAGGEPVPEVSEGVLESVIRDELILQEAVRIGLDQDPELRLRMGDLEAQLRELQRKELANLYRRHLRRRAAVTEREARDYFERNATRLRTRLHLLQIPFKRSSAESARVEEELRRGIPFEALAARRYPDLPAGVKSPWDLGGLRWFQLPREWHGVVDRLEPGQVSGVISGEGGRSWIVKLVGRSVDPSVTFETERERIEALLGQQQAEALWATSLAGLRDGARVVYVR